MELEKTSEAMRDFRAKTANIKAIQPSGKTVDPEEYRAWIVACAADPSIVRPWEMGVQDPEQDLEPHDPRI